MLLPSIASVEKINFRHTRWLLVIEKEVGFCALALELASHWNQGNF